MWFAGDETVAAAVLAPGLGAVMAVLRRCSGRWLGAGFGWPGVAR